jgi:hypothetical protein
MHDQTIESVLAALDYDIPKMVGEIWYTLGAEGSITLEEIEGSLDILVLRGDAFTLVMQGDATLVTKWQRARKQQAWPGQIERPTNAAPLHPGV